MSSTRTLLIGFSALAASLQLAAQTPQTVRTPDLAAAQPAPAYSSAFEGYKPFEAGDVQDWRKSNDTVRDIGGWRAYAKGMRAPAKPEGAAPPSGQEPAAKQGGSDPHAGHGK